MTREEFSAARRLLNKTQKEMAGLLGMSLKAVHSYDQGWRSVPPHVERQVLFLVSKMGDNTATVDCWNKKNCPEGRRKGCPAWELGAGKMCWFVNGTYCHGTAQGTWNEKMKICQACEILSPAIRSISCGG